MEIIYSVLVLVVLLVLGYLNKEKKEMFIFASAFLILGSFLTSYFLSGLKIYLVLFLLGFVLDRIYLRQKYSHGKLKAGFYRIEKDWVDRLLSGFIIVTTINIFPQPTNLLYSFLCFFLGIFISWILRKVESIKKFIQGI